MRYQAYLNGSIFFDTGVQYDGYLLTSAKVELAAGKAGSFTFGVPPQNIAYGAFGKLVDTVIVTRDDEEIFFGRVYGVSAANNTVQTITCEGYLAVLNDSLYPPQTSELSLTDLVADMLENHNEQCPAYPVYAGTIEYEDDLTYREYDSYKSTKERLDDLVDSYGGYLSIRHLDGVAYLDWLNYEDYISESRQSVDFGENLIKITQESTADDIVTILIPLGATEYDDDGNATTLDITSVNDGVEYIENADGIEQFGRIWGTKTWSDVTVASNLLTKATQWLEEQCESKVTIEVTAVDLANVGESVEHFQIGEWVTVTSSPHGISGDFLCTELTLNLLNPSKDELTLGDTRTGYVSAASKSIAANLTQIEYIISNYATNTALTSVREKVQTNTSLIEQTSENITLLVTQTVEEVAADIVTSEVESQITEVLSTYSTTEEVQALISESASSILLEVSGTYVTTTTYESGIASTLTSAEEYTDSQISILEDSILLEVSNTYVSTSTYTDGLSTTLESAKSYTDSAITVSETSILSTVSSTYVTTTTYNSGISALETAIEEADAAADAANTTAESAYSAATAVYGTSSTAASTAAKVVTCSDFALYNGACITVTFTYANTAGAITLNVNSTGALSIYVSGATASTSNYLLWAAGACIQFVYNGTYWVYAGGATSYKGTCSTAAATQAKTMGQTGAVICKGTNVDVTWTYGNTYASGAVTFDLGSTAAKNVYYGSAVTSTSNILEIDAAETLSFTFSGAYWYVSESAALTRIETATSTLESTIEQTAEEILSEVSATYATSDEVSTLESTISQTASSIALLVSASSDSNMLVDGGFECPAYWDNISSVFSLSSDSHSGDYCLAKAASSSVYAVYPNHTYGKSATTRSDAQPVAVEDGVTYLLSGWFMADEDAEYTTSNTKLRLGTTSSNTLITAFSAPSTVPTDWTYISGTWTNSAGYTEVNVQVMCSNTSGSVYWDDIRFEPYKATYDNVRSLFAMDSTSIEISSGTIAFKSDTITIDSDNFILTADGEITATSGTIGGWKISSSKLYISDYTSDVTGYDTGGTIEVYFNAGATWSTMGEPEVFSVTKQLDTWSSEIIIFDVLTTGDVEIYALSVTTSASISSTLSVTGAVTLSSTLTVSSYIYVKNHIYLTNAKRIYCYNASSTACTALYMSSSNYLYFGSTSYRSYLYGSAVYIAGSSYTTYVQGPLSVTGAATLSSTLAVTGAITASSTITASGIIYANAATGIYFGYGSTYHSMIRNDGSTFYILLTDSGESDWNSLRPFTIDKSAGTVFNYTHVGLRGSSEYYPHLFGNDTYLQISYTNDSSSGLVLQSTSVRPAVSATYTLGSSSKLWSTIYSSSSSISTSDERQKSDITDVDEDLAVSLITSLEPVTYKLNDGQSGRKHWGFTAQQMEEVMSELGIESTDLAAFVKTPIDSDGEELDYSDVDKAADYIYGMRYEELMAPLVKTVQAQQREIAALKAAINT